MDDDGVNVAGTVRAVSNNATVASSSSQNHNSTPLELCAKAREKWLSAVRNEDLVQVEDLYRRALGTKKGISSSINSSSSNDEEEEEDEEDNVPQDGSNKDRHKKRKRPNNNGLPESDKHAPLTEDQYAATTEKLCMLLCQSGRSEECQRPLSELGFTCRLANVVLNYPTTTEPSQSQSQSQQENKDRRQPTQPSPCIILDDFLNGARGKCIHNRLRQVFADPKADYWTSHHYQVEPPSPYFSYILPLGQQRPTTESSSSTTTASSSSLSMGMGMVGELVRQVYECPMLRAKFPTLKEARYAEMWAHNRPHATGHQMHFDSDDEGRGGVIRNPIMSTILYITDGLLCGGPSLVTNQTLASSHLANRGWLTFPKQHRLVAFDGKVLHGVVPGKGVSPPPPPQRANDNDNSGSSGSGSSGNNRRITLMFAFWKSIKVRDTDSIGSARPFPSSRMKDSDGWASQLTKPLPDECSSNSSSSSEVVIATTLEQMVETPPIAIDRVYETLEGKKWKRKFGLPEYDQVYQGF
eukprot:scaffold38522_cov50-Attheya_sp.AAC.1